MAAYSFTATAIDADSTAPQFSLIGNPDGASIDPTSGVFIWTPTEAQGPGIYNFKVRVTDTEGLFDEDSISIEVREVNIAPQLTSVPAPATIDELSAHGFTTTATDSDAPSQNLTFSLIGAPTGASITPGGVFSWTPSEAQGNGSTYTFTVRVSDGVVSTDAEVSLTVKEVNGAPTFAAIADQTVNELEEFSLNAPGSDMDEPANTLTYSLDAGFPTGMIIDAASGKISWTPTEAQGEGDHSVTVRATNNGTPSLSGTKTFNVHVNEVNVAPELATVGNKSVDEQTAVTFNASATDADLPANGLSYSLVGAPTGATITAGGAFSWTPTESQGPGTFPITIKVTDNGTPALSDEETITVTVNEVNNAPVLGAITTPASMHWGNVLGFTASATDSDLPANTLISVW